MDLCLRIAHLILSWPEAGTGIKKWSIAAGVLAHHINSAYFLQGIEFSYLHPCGMSIPVPEDLRSMLTRHSHGAQAYIYA